MVETSPQSRASFNGYANQIYCFDPFDSPTDQGKATSKRNETSNSFYLRQKCKVVDIFLIPTFYSIKKTVSEDTKNKKKQIKVESVVRAIASSNGYANQTLIFASFDSMTERAESTLKTIR